MAHFDGEQFVPLLRLLAAGHFEKDDGHLFRRCVAFASLATGGNPTNVGGIRQDAEVYLEGTELPRSTPTRLR